MTTKGELLKALEGLPDDTELVVHGGDYEYFEMHIERRLSPVLEHPWCVTFVEGQGVTIDYDMDTRSEFGQWWHQELQPPWRTP